ncbi:hypothetical protein ANCDUO_13400, partial [Ancylostoma duodenale]
MLSTITTTPIESTQLKYEVNGRQLRVDSAAGGDRSADEIQQLQAALSAAQVEESPYGPEPEEGRAPE